MSKKLEKERKFLVKFPTSWSVLSDIFDELIDIKRISQTYLKPEEDEQAARVRKTTEGLTGDTDTVYHFNRKKPVETGVHEEEEREITKSQYEKYLKQADPKKVAVEKTRFVFKYNDQTFELDVFKGPLKGLAIMEIELEDMDDEVELPPFLKIVKEVTEDKRFTNFSLADKKLNQKAKEL
jgi:CYTH domain-containing protein